MTRPGDRHSEERAHLDLRRLADDPTTRILEIVGDRAPVLDGAGADGGPAAEPALRLRAWEAADEEADLLVFLGRDDDGAAVLAAARPRGEQGGGDAPAAASSSTVSSSATSETATGPTSWQSLREIGPWLAEEDVRLFMTAQGMTAWHRSHRFCPRCGSATEPGAAGWVRRCLAEERELYPRTDPAVIMGIRDGQDRLLLGRAPSWPETRRSVLAGFVEPGESLEDAVRREVAEEVGLTVGRVEYAGSQPWPFPASLMVGFAGWATTTDIACEESEMAEAAWFDRAEIVAAVERGDILLPGRLSIARRLIEAWFGEPLHVPAIDERGGTPWLRPPTPTTPSA